MKKYPRAPLIWLALWFGSAIAVSLVHNDFQLQRSLSPPSIGFFSLHPFGFDAFGRDLLLTTLQGSLKSVFFAAVATLIAAIFGLGAGTTMALLPGFIRFPLLRGLDALLAFPAVLFGLGWAALYGPGWHSVFFALLIGTAPSLMRLVFVRTRHLLQEDFVLAAKGLGATSSRILIRHLLPGVIPFCSVKLPNLFAHALMAEATLTFLGLGAPLGSQTWGTLLLQGREYLIEAPHLALGAGLPLIATIVSLQLLQDHFNSQFR